MSPDTPGATAGRRPRLDLVERADDYRIFVDLPGSTTEDIQLDLADGVLALRARIDGRGSGSDGSSGRQALLPARPVEWLVSLDFGGMLSGDDLSAVYERGVLLVTLPKAQGRRARQIDVTES